MRRRSSLLPFLLILGVFLTAVSGWPQTRRVKFMAKDTAGNPIEGVSIAMTSPENAEFKKTVTTDKKGQCRFLIPMEIANITAVLEKEGYQKLEKPLNLKQLRSEQDSFSYEYSFLLYKSDEKSPEQKYQEMVDNKESRVQFDKGTELFQAEDFPGAIAAFSKAIELNPKFFEAYQNLAAAYFREKNYEKAIEIAKKALEINPNSAQTIKLISVAYSMTGDEKTALEYQEKLKNHPDAQFSPEELFNMGVVEANQGRDKEAVEFFKKAAEAKPDFADAYYQLGLAQFRLKNTAEAKTALEKYLELAPDGNFAPTAKQLLEFINKPG